MAPTPQTPRSVRALDILVCLSVANVCFLKLWQNQLPSARPPASFYYLQLPTPLQHLSLILSVTLTAAVLYGTLRFAKRQTRLVESAWYFGILLLMIFPVIAMGRQIQKTLQIPSMGLLIDQFGYTSLIAAGILVIAVSAALFFKFHPAMSRAIRQGYLFLSPLVLMFFAQAMWHSVSTDAPSMRAQTTPHQHHPIVVVIFDELDYALAFKERWPGLELPELDHVISTSLSANQAYSSAGHTMQSIPGLLQGRKIKEARPTSATALEVQPASGETWEDLRDHPNLFGMLKAAGRNIGVTGVYHPYCRLFAAELATCRSYNLYQLPFGTNLLTAVWRNFQELPLRRHSYYSLAVYKHMIRDVDTMLANDALDTYYFHWLLPHPPWIYDRQSQTLGTRPNHDLEGYAHNLALMDRTLGKIVKTLKERGQWDQTTLVITSDHHYRGTTGAPEPKADMRALHVPFILKLPGQTQPIAYDHVLQNTVTPKLLSQIESLSAANIVDWLDQQASE